MRRRKEDEGEEKEKVAVPDEEEEDASRIERVDGRKRKERTVYTEVPGRERRSRRARGRKASGGTSKRATEKE